MIASFPFLASSFDNDARTFINTSGATDRAAINHFVKGIKRLGLWSDMVCWPLRSAQNAGTGSTAYSLGGLGAYNGTLVNGPTWGADGVSFTAANSHRITTNLVAQVGASGGVYTANGGADRIVWSSRPDGAWTHGTALLARENSDTQALVDIGGDADARIRATRTAVLGQWVFLQATHTIAGTNVAANTTLRTNKNARGAGSYVVGSNENMGTSTTALCIGGNPSASQLIDGTMSLVYIATAIYSAAQQEQLYDLYRATLGQGLGLP
jgi:hypothetical protein